MNLLKICLLFSFLLLGENKRIYLTIDDGPSLVTSQLLEILRKHNVKATFFVLGVNIERYPDALKRIYKEGHLVGNHTYSHKNFYKARYDDKMLTEEIKKTEDEIIKIIGYKPRYLRYPYGFTSKTAMEIAASLGYKVVNWDFGYDWNPYDEERIINEYIKNLKPGSIILIHDTPKRKKMVLRLVEKIIIEAKKRGLEFARLDEDN